LTGDFIISPLPPFVVRGISTAGCLRSTGVTPLLSYYSPIRHPPVFDLLPGFSGYKIYLAPVISHRDGEGFSSCSICPCHRAVAITPLEWCAVSVRFRHPMLPSHSSYVLNLQGYEFSRLPLRSLSLRPGDSQPPSRWLCR
jgi:hypothetical protein